MAEMKLDFTGIKEYQPNNLCICSMGHITDRAIHPMWNTIPMASKARQYVPLGYIARNGLGEELMYCRYIGSATLTPNPVQAVIIAIGDLVSVANPLYSIRSTTTTMGANGVIFYPYTAGNTTTQYGWVRLLFARKQVPLT